ncbi:ANTAR domain-containing response regulator [Streptomyces sp. NPDC057654]|uniref:ANTAR domain-containing response regulator n=1 Tax=Streptomyces sp. NPDC057654 TaxID=3346196 RepID=UPI003687CD2E
MDTDKLPPVLEQQAAAALLALVTAPPHGEDDDGLLRRLVLSAAAVPGVVAAGCTATAVRDRPPRTAASNENAARLERLQDEGPGHDAARTGRALTDIAMDHLPHRTRWPRFTRQAREAGFAAVTVLPIGYADRTSGALSLYHPHGALRPSDAQWCGALAQAAAISLAHHVALHEALTRGDQLQNALDSRVRIEQAKGILAERFDCSLQDAFELLRRHARTHQMKLADLAHQVITHPADTGPFPGPRH